MKKTVVEYVISVPRREADMILNICWAAVEHRDKNKVPDKFVNAMLGLACRFNIKGRKRPAYKMSNLQIIGVLDVIGGYFMASVLMRDKGYDDGESFRYALSLMKIADSIERQAKRQGFRSAIITRVDMTKTPAPMGKPVLRLIEGFKK